MDPIIISLIATVSLGVVLGFAALFRQLILSRDKKSNDNSHRQAFDQESGVLGQMRLEARTHINLEFYLKNNNEKISRMIQHVDVQITALKNNKKEILDLHRSRLEGGVHIEATDLSEAEKEEILSYDKDIKQLTKRLADLWKIYMGNQQELLDQMKAHKDDLMKLTREHTNILMSIILRHIGSMEEFGLKTMQAGSVSFKEIILFPFQQLFRLMGKGSSPDTSSISGSARGQVDLEAQARQGLDILQRNLNETAGDGARYRFIGASLQARDEERATPLIGSATI